MTFRPTSSPRHARQCRGFTLIELLVVIGIIALIASIAVVVASRARKSANKSILAFQLQGIAAGMEAYLTDFNAYPITTLGSTTSSSPDYEINFEGMRGARTLCKALMGPCVGSKSADKTTFTLANPSQDGKDGFGFAVPGRSGLLTTNTTTGELQGKTYGPYLAVDKFTVAKTFTVATATKKVGDIVEQTDDPTNYKIYDDTSVILDANGLPILYYPVLNPQAPAALADGYVARGFTESTSTYTGTSAFASRDNEVWLPATVLRKELGLGPAAKYGTPSNDAAKVFDPRTPTGTQLTDNRAATAGETPAHPKYILWCAGPDGIFGPNMTATGKQLGVFDDVTNFQGE